MEQDWEPCPACGSCPIDWNDDPHKYVAGLRTADEATALQYAELAGELASIIEWFVTNADQCLADHPQRFAQAKEVYSKALDMRETSPTTKAPAP